MPIENVTPVFVPGAPYQIGLAALLRAAFYTIDLKPLGQQLIEYLETNPDDAYALMDLSIILQLLGNDAVAEATQGEAIALRNLYHLPTAVNRPARLRLLALAVAGDFMANTPLEFLLVDSDIALDVLYLLPDQPVPDTLPPHDVLFIACGESDRTRRLLYNLSAFAKTWKGPLLNRPDKSLLLSRDRVAVLLQAESSICMPITVRASPEALHDIAEGRASVVDFLGDGDFPLIIRPVGSHAGKGLEKLSSPHEIEDYMARVPDSGYFISRFVDYSDSDGMFRKYRIVLIEGVPFLCHMGISEHWMIHYLNAGMTESQAKRDEEAATMASFDEVFAPRHREAFALIQSRFGLDYIGLDCAETEDGELLIFEVDTGMIVHGLDPMDMFPYKQIQMEKVFAAFRGMLYRRAGKNAHG